MVHSSGLCRRKALLAFSLFLLLVLPLQAAELTLPAFPGAEGAGAFTPGGRGGKVYLVTTLADYLPGKEPVIPGSLRAAVEAKEARVVVFRVSGYIDLKTKLGVRNPYITIAGQTAPGDGICLRNYEFYIGNTHDCIVRHLRCRTGDHTSKAGDLDALTLWGAKNVIIDHCSATWATDECLSVTNDSDNVTVQWCIIAEGLTKHSYGSLIGSYGGKLTFHHNLYAHNVSRNPRPTGYHYVKGHENDPGPVIDFRNNVIYNWGSVAGYTGSGDEASSPEKHALNYVGNYLKPGPSSPARWAKTAFLLHKGAVTRLYADGNHMEGFPEGSADNWRLIDDSRCPATKLTGPVPVAAMKTEDAPTAFKKVLADVGATVPVRDAVDTRIVNSTRDGTGKIAETLADLGGWPELKTAEPPADSDSDGMPDAWEQKHGLNPADPSDNNKDADGDGYTNIEEFLNATNPMRGDH